MNMKLHPTAFAGQTSFYSETEHSNQELLSETADLAERMRQAGHPAPAHFLDVAVLILQDMGPA